MDIAEQLERMYVGPMFQIGFMFDGSEYVVELEVLSNRNQVRFRQSTDPAVMSISPVEASTRLNRTARIFSDEGDLHQVYARVNGIVYTLNEITPELLVELAAAV